MGENAEISVEARAASVIRGDCRIFIERLSVENGLPLAGWKYGAAAQGDVNAAIEIVWTMFPGALIELVGPTAAGKFMARLSSEISTNAQAGDFGAALLAAGLKAWGKK